MNRKLFQILCLIACAALTGCGTVANTAVAGYESNIATNQIAAGQNILNAKVFALCMTPWYDIVQSPVQYQQGIEKMCVKSSATTNAVTMIQAAQAASKAIVPEPAK